MFTAVNISYSSCAAAALTVDMAAVAHQIRRKIHAKAKKTGRGNFGLNLNL